MADWRVLYGTVAGTVLGELPATSFTYELGLNRAGSVRVTLPLRPLPRTLQLPLPGVSVTSTTITTPTLISPTTLYPARSAVWVERGGIVQAGAIVWTVAADVASDKLEVAGEGYHSYFRRRLIRSDLVYSASDQGAIARNLLEIAQLAPGGNIGVLTPLPAASVNRDRTYFAYERKSIGEAIEQLAAVSNGFDWSYRPAWSGSTIATTFTVSYPATGRPTAAVFELGVNVDLLAAQVDGTTMANGVDAIGAGEGNAMALVPRSDPGSLASYPLIEDVVTYKDVDSLVALEAHANRRLDRGRQPLTTVRLRLLPGAIPELGSFEIGDQVRVRGTHGWLSLDDVYRVVSISVAVDDSGEQASVDLAPLVLFAS